MNFTGKGVSRGVAMGRIHYIGQAMDIVENEPIENVEHEIARFNIARAEAAKQIGEIAVRTSNKLGKEKSLLFEVHQMMLEDLDYRESVESIIASELCCAEHAVSETAKEFSQVFSEMDDPYMQARAADVLDVSRRVVEILQGKQHQQSFFAQPVILAGQDFAPSETALLDPKTTLALLTVGGSANSHTAIFARTMGIPAVIGLGSALGESWDGHFCVIDGETGEVILDPTPEEIEVIEKKRAAQIESIQRLEAFRGKPAQTKSGRRVELFANVGNVRDAALAMQNDAEGIGLFRSEFLYLESRDYPTEDEQLQAYKAVAETMQGRMVVIRTLDIGADKQVKYFNLPVEENPAMGLRALRICLTRPEVFKTQLRAIYRASAFGRVAIMLPMVASLWEIQKAKELAAEVRAALDEEGTAYDKAVPIGIMIETPAAAVISDILAQEADFFSIGTNDLTQYTLAVDRQNQALESFVQKDHPAILRLIETAVSSAHKAGIWCGICGELGAEQSLTAKFLEIGVDELSVTPPAILPLKKHICELD
ncbi:MAG: phosphoenolpyruvate--protein phosphotransferase [Oscillospiraceae bacterium]|jgi:phosphotransferase system enzyme I (PtsI)|nr:phosphoenolpyruvate--protein phosphotransferase [Oscillospiraceae bacterium]